MASSPDASPTTSRFFSTLPSSVPQRTYSRRSLGKQRQVEPVISRAESLIAGAGNRALSPSPSPVTLPARTTRNKRTTPVLPAIPGQASSSRRSTRSRGGDPSSQQTLGLGGQHVGTGSQTEEGAGQGQQTSVSRGRKRSVDVPSPALSGSAPSYRTAGEKRKRGKEQVQVQEQVAEASVTVARAATRRSARHSSATNSTTETTLVERPRTSSPSPPRRAPEGVVSGEKQARQPQTPPRSVRPSLPRTPTTSSPRDFAELFAAVSPGVGKSPRFNTSLGKSLSSGLVLDSPSKMRKRFERISRQNSFGASMSPGPSTPSKRLGKTQSMPITPSKSSPAAVFTGDTEAEGDLSAMLLRPAVPEGQGSGGRAKRTYGKTRTVLAEGRHPGGEDEQEPKPTMEETLGKESYADLRRRYEVDPGEIAHDDLSSLIAARPPQPVNDMRSKGENRRYLDETGFLLDGIVDPSASAGYKRSSCVDLLGNMMQDDWLAKMKICGKTEDVWAAFAHARGSGDDLMDAVCLLALYIIVLSGDGIEAIVRSDGDHCVAFVLAQLAVQDGTLDAASTVKRTPLVQRVLALSTKMPSLEDRQSTRLVASAVLDAICQHPIVRAALPHLAHHHALVQVGRLLVASASVISSRFESHALGLDLLPPDDTVDTRLLSDWLSVADTLVVLLDTDRAELANHLPSLPQALLHLLIAMTSVASPPEYTHKTEACFAILYTLKMYANMLNVATTWTTYLSSTPGAALALARILVRRRNLVARPTGSQDGDENEESVTDVGPDELLSLVLAIMTGTCIDNVAFTELIAQLGGFPLSLSVQGWHRMTPRVAFDPECSGAGSCLLTCQCPASKPFVEILVDLYIEYGQESTQADTGVTGAYLGLLLTKIITLSSSTVDDSQRIISLLPGSTRQEKLRHLSASLEDLEGFRSIVQRQVRDLAGSEGRAEGEEGESLEEDHGVVRKAIADLAVLLDS